MAFQGFFFFCEFSQTCFLQTDANCRANDTSQFLQRFAHVGKLSWSLLSLLAIIVPGLNWLEHKAERLRVGKDSRKVGRRRSRKLQDQRKWKPNSCLSVYSFKLFHAGTNTAMQTVHIHFTWEWIHCQVDGIRRGILTGSLKREISICLITFIIPHLLAQKTIKNLIDLFLLCWTLKSSLITLFNTKTSSFYFVDGG